MKGGAILFWGTLASIGGVIAYKNGMFGAGKAAEGEGSGSMGGSDEPSQEQGLPFGSYTDPNPYGAPYAQDRQQPVQYIEVPVETAAPDISSTDTLPVNDAVVLQANQSFWDTNVGQLLIWGPGLVGAGEVTKSAWNKVFGKKTGSAAEIESRLASQRRTLAEAEKSAGRKLTAEEIKAVQTGVTAEERAAGKLLKSAGASESAVVREAQVAERALTSSRFGRIGTLLKTPATRKIIGIAGTTLVVAGSAYGEYEKIKDISKDIAEPATEVVYKELLKSQKMGQDEAKKIQDFMKNVKLPPTNTTAARTQSAQQGQARSGSSQQVSSQPAVSQPSSSARSSGSSSKPSQTKPTVMSAPKSTPANANMTSARTGQPVYSAPPKTQPSNTIQSAMNAAANRLKGSPPPAPKPKPKQKK